MKIRIDDKIKNLPKEEIVPFNRDCFIMTKDLPSSFLLSHLLLNAIENNNNWVSKSYDQWFDELALEQEKIVDSKKLLLDLGVVEIDAGRIRLKVDAYIQKVKQLKGDA